MYKSILLYNNYWGLFISVLFLLEHVKHLESWQRLERVKLHIVKQILVKWKNNERILFRFPINETWFIDPNIWIWINFYFVVLLYFDQWHWFTVAPLPCKMIIYLTLLYFTTLTYPHTRPATVWLNVW